MTKLANLEFVWRNPELPQRHQRWEQINLVSGMALYLVQESVSTSIGSFWSTTSSLEVVRGGRVA